MKSPRHTRTHFRLATFLLALVLGACGGQTARLPEATMTPTMPPTTIQATPTYPPGTTLPFTTIDQDYWPGTGHYYEAKEPALIVITGPEDIRLIADWISPEGLSRLQGVNYADNLALVVFQGWKPTLSYGVQIQQITYREGIVNVYAQFEEPEPGTEELTAVSSPYHLVQLQRFEGLGERTRFDLIANGTLVDSYTLGVATPTPTPTPTQPVYPYPPPPSTPDAVLPYP
jgi:hypothetical protein